MKLINADCMDFMRDCKDGQFDLAIVDPPYFKGVADLGFYGEKISGTGVVRQNFEMPAQYWDEQIPNIKYYKELCRISKHQIIWGINYFEFSNLTTCGRIVWDKKNDHSSFSHCEIASCSLIKSIRIFRYTWAGMRQERMDWRKEEKIHPTQKPIALYEWLMMNYAQSNQSILDTHMGSGSSAIAANNLGFDYTGIEIDPNMFEKAKKRIEVMTQQKRLFV